MLRVRHLLFGCALVIGAGAQAADLPVARATPVEYVRLCSGPGAGFFYVPGTDTCLRVGGRVRAEMLYVDRFTRVEDPIGYRSYGRLNVDARTATAYGPLRSYIRMLAQNRSGTPFGSTGSTEQRFRLEQAFVQFAGLTAGRITSFFTDPNLPAPNFGDLRFDDPSNADVNLLAYTFSFSKEFSATLSLETAQSRRVNNDLDFPLFTTGIAPLPFTYAGERVPDVVGNLRYTGTWGGVQLASVLHEIQDVAAGFTTVNNVVVPVLNPITGQPNPARADTTYGFAFALHGYANLPALGPGDAVWVSATYTDGAVGYINAGQADPIGAPAEGSGSIGAGPLSLPFADASVNPFTGQFQTNLAYGVAGGINHNWTPMWQTNVFGSWMHFDAPTLASSVVPTTAATLAVGTAGTVTGLVDFDEFRLGTNTIWTPVKGLQMGVEVLYTLVDPRGRVAVPITDQTGEATGFFKPTGSHDIWESRLRIQYDF